MLFAGRYEIKTRFWFVSIAMFLAVMIYFFNLDEVLSTAVYNLGIFGSFLAGAFYTFGLTTPTAFLILIETMSLNNYVLVAITASFSAALVDTILFMLVKKELEKNAAGLIKKIRKRFGKQNFIFSFIGFFLFGSPLPDELGLAFMQIVKIEPLKIWIIVFCAKVLTLILTYKAIYG